MFVSVSVRVDSGGLAAVCRGEQHNLTEGRRFGFMQGVLSAGFPCMHQGNVPIFMRISFHPKQRGKGWEGLVP